MTQKFVYSTPLNSAYFVFMNWEKGWLLLSNYRSSLHILHKLLHGWSLIQLEGLWLKEGRNSFVTRHYEGHRLLL